MKKPTTLIVLPHHAETLCDNWHNIYCRVKSSKEIVYPPRGEVIFPHPDIEPVLLYLIQGHEEVDIKKIQPIAPLSNILQFDLVKFNDILKNKGKCFVEWEENQCDGCRARIPIVRGRAHQKPNDPTDRFGIVCTAYLYDRPKLTDGKITLSL